MLLIGLLIVAGAGLTACETSEPAGAGGAADSTSHSVPTSLPVRLDEDNFERLVEQPGSLALVDFWATWCGPCKTVAPTIKRLAKKYEGRVLVGKLDVDEAKSIANRFSIRSIPTLMFFRDGKVVDQMVGVVPQETIEARLEGLLR